MQFNELSLDPKLLQAVEAAGFKTPTPIQSQAIPVVLTGGDLMASAQTGTGKTAAFVLPILHRLLQPSKKSGKGPRVLVLTPTRELATQIDDDIKKFGRFCKLRAGNVVGGVGYGPQIKLLRNPLDLLVATPGRLMDHMDEGLVDFSRLEVLVLDEADRMLDMGFIKPVRKIVSATPDDRQTLLFSATLEGDVQTMSKEFMRDPARIQLAVNTRRHDGITQLVYQADDPSHKHRLLEHHLDDEALTQAVVFTRTKRLADRLSKRLSSQGVRCAPLHGDMRQGARKKTIDQMKAGTVRVLVATDVAARGLDIKGISHVINYDLPMVAEDYIHRIGRTARAGASGTAISFVGPDEWERLSQIKRLTGWELPREIIVGLEPLTSEPRMTSNGGGNNGSTKKKSRSPRRRSGGGGRGGNGSSSSGHNPSASKTLGSGGNSGGRPAAKKRRRRSNRPKAIVPRSNAA